MRGYRWTRMCEHSELCKQHLVNLPNLISVRKPLETEARGRQGASEMRDTGKAHRNCEGSKFGKMEQENTEIGNEPPLFVTVLVSDAQKGKLIHGLRIVRDALRSFFRGGRAGRS